MFSELPVAMVTANRATSAHVLSARPDAPVVPDVVRTPRLAPALTPIRTGLARTLRRAADRVAPARPVTSGCVPTHA